MGRARGGVSATALSRRGIVRSGNVVADAATQRVATLYYFAREVGNLPSTEQEEGEVANRRCGIANTILNRFGGSPASRLFAEAEVLAGVFVGDQIAASASPADPEKIWQPGQGFGERYCRVQARLLAATVAELSDAGICPVWLATPPEPASPEAQAVLTLAAVEHALAALEGSRPTGQLQEMVAAAQTRMRAASADLQAQLPAPEHVEEYARRLCRETLLLAAVSDPACMAVTEQLQEVTRAGLAELEDAGLPHSAPFALAVPKGMLTVGWPSPAFVNDWNAVILDSDQATEIVAAFADGELDPTIIHETIHSGQTPVSAEVKESRPIELELCEATTESLTRILKPAAADALPSGSGYEEWVAALNEMVGSRGFPKQEFLRELSAVPDGERLQWLHQRFAGAGEECTPQGLADEFERLSALAGCR